MRGKSIVVSANTLDSAEARARFEGLTGIITTRYLGMRAGRNNSVLREWEVTEVMSTQQTETLTDLIDRIGDEADDYATEGTE